MDIRHNRMQSTKISTVISELRKLASLSRLTHSSCTYYKEASATSENAAEDEETASLAAAELQKLEKMRDKSKLQPQHYKILYRIPQAMDSLEQDVSSVREVRARYGRDGDGSQVDLRYMWPSKEEMYYLKEFEKVLNPLNVSDMMQKAKREKAEAVEFAVKRQKDIMQNMKSLEQWKSAIRNKIKAKEDAAREAREKRELLIEEVRLFYGARIDPRDEKFQEILAQKEEEEKKAQKALKKQQKQQIMMEKMKKLIEKAKEAEAAASEGGSVAADKASKEGPEKAQ